MGNNIYRLLSINGGVELTWHKPLGYNDSMAMKSQGVFERGEKKMAVQAGCRVLERADEHLDFLFEELAEECKRILDLIEKLKKTDVEGKLRGKLEGDLYAALWHLKTHVPALIKEWDRADLGD